MGTIYILNLMIIANGLPQLCFPYNIKYRFKLELILSMCIKMSKLGQEWLMMDEVLFSIYIYFLSVFYEHLWMSNRNVVIYYTYLKDIVWEFHVFWQRQIS